MRAAHPHCGCPLSCGPFQTERAALQNGRHRSTLDARGELHQEAGARDDARRSMCELMDPRRGRERGLVR